ncbi:MAG TPA: FhaA domain-containing protein [Candidatus Lustribacter sp.]|nr:FhaA domain-containing protein [Candidatus Lustribacter sp.]
MGLFDRVERGLERAVSGAFAKAFKSEVQPVEIAAAIRRRMDDRAALLGHGRTIVPNLYTVELSPTDFERLAGFEEALSEELVASAEEHVDTQRYTPGGPVQVLFSKGEDLETGVFRVGSATTKSRPTTPRHEPASEYEAQPAPGLATAASPPVAAPATSADRPDPIPTAAPSPAHEPAHRSTYVNPAERPWLDVDGDRYPLIGAISVVGRDASADIVLNDPGISRRHSEIRVTNDGPHLVSSIRDLASTNGTFVNGDRITSRRLQDGDAVTVGRTTVTFHAGTR